MDFVHNLCTSFNLFLLPPSLTPQTNFLAELNISKDYFAPCCFIQICTKSITIAYAIALAHAVQDQK